MILSVIGFVLCGLAGLALVLIGRREDPLASASDLFDTVLGSRTARIAILVLWWWLGWHFLVAQTVDPN